MATSTVTFTAGSSEELVAYYIDGRAEGIPGSMGYDDSEIWTVEAIEADLAKTYRGKPIEVLSID